MTRLEGVRMAWSGAAGALTAAWLYLSAFPSVGSYWIDNATALFLVLAGAAGAAVAEHRIELAIRTRPVTDAGTAVHGTNNELVPARLSGR